MVQTTLKEVFSGSSASGARASARRGRMKGKPGIPFAAILEKTLNAAAPGKKPGVKHAGPAIRPAKARMAENVPAEKRTLAAEHKRSPRIKEEVYGFSAAPEKVKELQPGLVPAEEKRPSPEAPRSLAAKASAIPADAPNKDFLFPAMNLSGGKTGELKQDAGEKLSAGEKPKAAAGKTVSAKHETEAPRRKESQDEAKKAEKQDPALVLREARPQGAEEPKHETPRQEIEIRVVMRATDERFDDTLRTADDRSVKESASGLLRRMREDGNSDIVRSARFILKDANEGEIRLVLKPASLGEVRIHLSLQDSLIGGKVFVENESVRSVFMQNMPDLASAFRENGLQLGELAVSVGNGERREGGEGGSRTMAEKKTETAVDAPAPVAAAYYFVPHRVNVMA